MPRRRPHLPRLLPVDARLRARRRRAPNTDDGCRGSEVARIVLLGPGKREVAGRFKLTHGQWKPRVPRGRRRPRCRRLEDAASPGGRQSNCDSQSTERRRDRRPRPGAFASCRPPAPAAPIDPPQFATRAAVERSLLTRYRVFDDELGGRSAKQTTENFRSLTNDTNSTACMRAAVISIVIGRSSIRCASIASATSSAVPLTA
jgi:hypothetical protein